MFYKLINYYNNKLGSYNLVFRFVKIRWLIFLIFLYLSMVLFPADLYIIVKNDFRLKNLIVIAPLLGLLVMYFYLNSKAKSILEDKYEILPDGHDWHNAAFDEHQVQLLIKYLKNDNLYSVDIIKHLISLVYKEAEEKKYNGFVLPGILLALLIPIWNQIVSYGYKGVSGLQEVTTITILFIICTLYFVLLLSMSKRIVDDFIKEVFNRKYIKMRNLCKLLESVLLQAMKEEKSKEEKSVDKVL